MFISKSEIEKFKEEMMMYEGRLLWGAVEFLLKQMKDREEIFFNSSEPYHEREKALIAYRHFLYILGIVLLNHSESEKDLQLFQAYVGEFIMKCEKYHEATMVQICKFKKEELNIVEECMRLANHINSKFEPRSTIEEMKKNYLDYNLKKK